MSWLTNLFKKNNSSNTNANQQGLSGENNPLKASLELKEENEEHINISIGDSSVRFLTTTKFIDNKCQFLWMDEIHLSQFENKKKGEPVDNIFYCTEQAFLAFKEKIYDKKNIKISLPSQGVFFKNITIPKIDNNKDELIKAEFKRAIPIPFEDLFFASNLSFVNDDNNEETYFCLAVSKEYISKFEEIFTKLNIKPYYELEVFSLSRILPKDDRIKCIVNIGSNLTLFVFVKNAFILGVNIIEHGYFNVNLEMIKKTDLNFEQAEDLKINYNYLLKNKLESAGVVEDFLVDFSRKISKNIATIVLNFERQYNIMVDEIAVCGGGSMAINLKENIHDEFENNVTVKILNSQNVIIDIAGKLHEENLGRFAQCIGLLLS